jgi:hypothetical protein
MAAATPVASSTALSPPATFRFKDGVTPYPIQDAFMRSAFEVAERGGLAILESPTGTVRESIKIVTASFISTNIAIGSV